MSEDSGEKTEAPTAKRKKDAVEKGDILKSRDFATALSMLAGVAWLIYAGPTLISACKAIMSSSFQFTHADVEDFSPWRPLMEAGGKLAPSLITLFIVSIGAAILSQAGLGSLGFNGGLLAPKYSRVDPAAGLKRIFGANGWIELGKSLLKVILLGTIGGWMLWNAAHSTIGLASSADLNQALLTLGGIFKGILIAMAFGLCAIAGIDLPIQIIRRLGKMRMSKQEVKDEHKSTEGNGEAKGQMRAKMRAMASGGLRKSVAEAHVVLTNPTHFAVALRYDRGKDQVPVVVAKGRGATALAIRELAGEGRVPILEYPTLARAVYYTSNEGQEVRDDLYTAIATVLAFVFGLNAAAGGTAGGVQPFVTVPKDARFDENGMKQA
ncbi:flagellar biosynthesis protein FlhB [Sphingomonas sp. Leaf208]|jgi:flagellar biosynthetic protein FlhB|uniref:flagellar type III secretion system protein FlhB n=1 Tax=Sphingomonas sp. Leaf208 TaxID=1735679 RepID=UPI0006F42FD4|nr:flagellar type III secretion system protein FlhB [Sphingomonas sp. Leaf208]KQM53295.1 flagellar biosynthesis protein FlhB [Sphingomonas sp. Leaf208]